MMMSCFGREFCPTLDISSCFKERSSGVATFQNFGEMEGRRKSLAKSQVI